MPTAPREAGIEGRGLTPIFFEHRDDSVSIARYDFPRVVRGAVVYHDDFHAGGGLMESAIDRVFQETAIVIVIHDNASGYGIRRNSSSQKRAHKGPMPFSRQVDKRPDRLHGRKSNTTARSLSRTQRNEERRWRFSS